MSRYALILAVITALFLFGCTTTDEGTRNERHIDRLMRQHDWPLIQQIAEKEVQRRETSWPDRAEYLPAEHKEKLWTVVAMAATSRGEVERVVYLTIGDDGKVQAYQRYWGKEAVDAFPDRK